MKEKNSGENNHEKNNHEKKMTTGRSEAECYDSRDWPTLFPAVHALGPLKSTIESPSPKPQAPSPKPKPPMAIESIP
jgi:hypothetical protein